jgi:NADH-quinone oxidoreductase subunit A
LYQPEPRFSARRFLDAPRGRRYSRRVFRWRVARFARFEHAAEESRKRIARRFAIAVEVQAMLAEYTGVLVILVIAMVVILVLRGVHMFMGPRREFPEKQEPFECGEKPLMSPHQRYAVKFYLVAILFVVFDVEAIFFYPWGAVFSQLGWYGFTAMFIFTVPLAVGLAYEWLKGGLEW